LPYPVMLRASLSSEQVVLQNAVQE